MSYQDPYSGSNSPQYGQPAPAAFSGPQVSNGFPGAQPPRRRKGLKRIILGSVGLLLNLIGLVVMPFVAAMILAVVTVASADLTPVDPDGGTFQADFWGVYSVAVPADEVADADCVVTGAGVSADRSATEVTAGTIDGVEYVEIYDVSATSEQEVTVECTGVTSAAVSEFGMAGTLIGFGIGLVVPIALGILSLIVLIWGIVARVRS